MWPRIVYYEYFTFGNNIVIDSAGRKLNSWRVDYYDVRLKIGEKSRRLWKRHGNRGRVKPSNPMAPWAIEAYRAILGERLTIRNGR